VENSSGLAEDRGVRIGLVTWTAAAALAAVAPAAANEAPSVESTGGPRMPAPIVWRAPSLDGWTPEVPVAHYRSPTRPPEGYTHVARPDAFRVPVYDRLTSPRAVVARTRRGNALPARPVEPAQSCYDQGETGRWWEVPGGFICSTSGYTIARTLIPERPRQRRPALNLPLPFRYARITTKGAPRFSRRPTLEELTAVRGWSDDDSGPSSVIERMWDDFFVALDRREEVGGEIVYRTVYGEYVREEDTKLLEPPPMVGERLGPSDRLPIAFVYGEEAAVLRCTGGRGLETCGRAEKHARFKPQGHVSRDGQHYVRGPDGALIPADRLRIVRAIGRPPGVGPDEKWIHVNLGEQTLVAYEGERPVYATLVSSGKSTHATPTGLYQVQRKYLTKIMRGRDPKEGIYHVEEVPWTTYYHGAYAVHGAYWHNTFGSVRSHGCTNVSPADARWLYFWGEPEHRPHFHAQVREQATHIYFSAK
jgi:hypothetical protein